MKGPYFFKCWSTFLIGLTGNLGQDLPSNSVMLLMYIHLQTGRGNTIFCRSVAPCPTSRGTTKWLIYVLSSIIYIVSGQTPTLVYIKKENQIYLMYKEFRMEQLQSHIWLTASTVHIYGEIFAHSSYIRKLFLIYDFATAPLWISIYMRKILFSFLSVYLTR